MASTNSQISTFHHPKQKRSTGGAPISRIRSADKGGRCLTIQICDSEEEEPQHPLLVTVKEDPLAMVGVAMAVPHPATVVVHIQHLAIMAAMEEVEGRDPVMGGTVVVKVKTLALPLQWIR
jgi:hypothetical protein